MGPVALLCLALAFRAFDVGAILEERILPPVTVP